MLKRGVTVGLVGSCIVLVGIIVFQTDSLSKSELNTNPVAERSLAQPLNTALMTESSHFAPQTLPILESKDGEATIAWQVPSYRASGVEMEWQEISSFRIYHISDNPKEKEQVYEVPWNQTEIHVTGLSKGWHHFSISVVDQDGSESVLSKNVSKQII